MRPKLPSAHGCRPRHVVLLHLCWLLTWTLGAAAGPVCKLHITAAPFNITASKLQQGAYEHASLQCSGGGVTACINKRLSSLLIKGVQLNTSCCKDKCLLTICGSTQVTFRDAHVTGVHMMTPLCIAGAANASINGNSTFSQNSNPSMEDYNGGAIAAYDSSMVTIGGFTRLERNNASWGGGVFAQGHAVVVITDASSITHNDAVSSCGGVCAVGQANMAIIGHARICNNTGYHGGGTYAGDTALVQIAGNTVVCNNTAGWIGGGIVAANRGTVIISGNSRVVGNSAATGTGGGVLAWHKSRVMVAGNSSITRNLAGSGGGIAGWEDSAIILTGDSRVEGNRALKGTGGGLIIQAATQLNISGNSTIANNTSTETGAGIGADGTATIDIGSGVKFINNTVSRIINNSVDLYQAGADIRVVDYVRLSVAPGGGIDRCSASVFLKRKSCEAGEFPLMGACVCCQNGTYSLSMPEANGSGKAQVCEQCPLYASCYANSIIPDEGYWHSSTSSTQVHACPIKEACGPGGKCRDGFTGNLCGVCTADLNNQTYGITTPLMCRPCQNPRVQFGVYASVSFITVCLIALTVHATWRDNCFGSRHVRATDMIKVLVYFLQYLVILGSVSAPWPHFMRILFSISSIVFGAASGQAVSLDCWLMHYVPLSSLPLAIQRQLVYFTAPVAVLAAVVLLEVLWWAGGQAGKALLSGSRWQAPELLLARKLPVMVLVVVFFAYPSLLRASAGFFACLRIDLPNMGKHPEHAVLTHFWGYWVGYMDQPCFVGWHKAWALSLGLIGVMVFCVGIPVALFWWLKSNQARCNEAAFREHYGFLYRNYRKHKEHWEAVWAVQTVLLTMVAVFHFKLGAYYSVLLLQTIFMLSAALQVAFKPYALAKLHRLHLTATACLVFTGTGTLTFFTFGSQDPALGQAHWAIGVLVLVADAAFICWCLYQIVASSINMPRCLVGLQPCNWCRNANCRCLGSMQAESMRMRASSWWKSLFGTAQPQPAANLQLQLGNAGAVQEQSSSRVMPQRAANLHLQLGNAGPVQEQR